LEVLASRFIFHPSDLQRSREFYEKVLELRLFHEYRSQKTVVGVVYFLGGGYLELSGQRPGAANRFARLWIQVPDVKREQARLEDLAISIEQPAERKPWGLIELVVRDPDGLEVLLVETPEDHFLRRQL
jgi:catechol 2,3-dioxygenase-like lactoylglutathione lyase family enzyme